nr:immunoglobulin light chain junction region [Macaca mulatta]
CMQYKHIPWTF